MDSFYFNVCDEQTDDMDHPLVSTFFIATVGYYILNHRIVPNILFHSLTYTTNPQCFSYFHPFSLHVLILRKCSAATRGASSSIQNDDAPCRTENYAILGYCLEYYNDNPYITEFFEKIYSPEQLASFQGPMEGDIAETVISLDEKFTVKTSRQVFSNIGDSRQEQCK